MTKSEDLTYVASFPSFPASSFCLFTTVQKHYLYRIKTWRWGRPANIPYVSEPVSYGFVFLETRVRQEFALSKHFSNTGTDFLIFCVLFRIPRSTQSSFSALHVVYCLQQLWTETWLCGAWNICRNATVSQTEWLWLIYTRDVPLNWVWFAQFNLKYPSMHLQIWRTVLNAMQSHLLCVGHVLTNTRLNRQC